MISLATEADRTLYFDFLPINIGTINGFAAKFQLYTVPGQVYYNATRKLVLRGVDGVVFVADSQPDKMDENIDSLLNLEDNLREYGYDLNELPLVIQYNKRDLPGVMSVEEMNAKLNPRNVPCFEASATLGNGVFDTLKRIIKLVLDKAKQSSGPKRTQPLADGGPPPAERPAEPAQSQGQPAAAAPSSTEQESPDAATVSRETVRADLPTESAPPAAAAASAGTSTATATKPPEASPATQYRPYPGSQSQKIAVKDKKMRPSTFTPVRGEQPQDDSLERKVVSGDAEAKDDEDGLSTPVMAPSLKRRGEHKKRGFIKRLFGIK
jgi:signal recognition particle receptor subunit beta